MARRKSGAAASRALILDAAWALLLARGPAGLSIDAVIARAGLSKGTFFHVLDGKHALLDAMAERIADLTVAVAQFTLVGADRPPLARLDAWWVAGRAWRTHHPAALVALHAALASPDHHALAARVTQRIHDQVAPLLAALLAEAHARGDVHVSDPEITARMLLVWSATTADANLRALAAGEDPAITVRRANIAIEAFERALAAPPGSFTRVDDTVVAAFSPTAAPAGGPHA